MRTDLPLRVARAQFTRILIIQSLPEADGNPGRRLRDDLDPLTIDAGPRIGIDLVTPTTWAELQNVLRVATDRARDQGDRPIVHFECHGSIRPDGIQLASGETVTWETLKPHLVELNIATHCHLLVTLASCWGASLGAILTINERAPFMAYVGATRDVRAGEVEAGFSAFYRELLTSLDGVAALRALRLRGGADAPYFFMMAPQLLVNAYRRLSTDVKQEGIWSRATKLRKRMQAERRTGIPSTQKMVALWHSQKPRTIAGIIEHFLMIDLFPENAERFPVSVDELEALARAPS